MKKILQIVETLDCGGIETLLMSIHEKIDRKEYKIDYLLAVDRECFYSKKAIELGANIYYVPSRKKGISHIVELFNFFKTHKYDVVHYNCSSLSNFDYIFFAKMFKVNKIIVHGHSVQEPNSKVHYYLHSIFRNIVSKFASDFLSCSDEASDWMYTKKILRSPNHKIIHNGIDFEKFEYSEEKRREIRSSLSISDNTVLLGNFSRFVESKNQLFNLKIMNILNYHDVDYKLLLIGDGPEKRNVESYAITKKIEDKIIFLNSKENICDYFQALDMFVFPSKFEGLGMVLIEANTSGLPCIFYENLPSSLNKLAKYYRMPCNSTPIEWGTIISSIYKDKSIYTRTTNYIDEYDINNVVSEVKKIYD